MIESASKNPVKYMVIYPELKDFKTNMNVSYSDQWLNTRSYGYYSGGTKWKDVLQLQWTQTIRSRISFTRIASNIKITFRI